jgi:hypothetical protein
VIPHNHRSFCESCNRQKETEHYVRFRSVVLVLLPSPQVG